MKKRLLIGGVAFVVLLAAAATGAGWYYSDQVLKVEHGSEFPLKVLAADGDRVTLPLTDETRRKGTWGIAWPEGYATLGEVVREGRGSVDRMVKVSRGSLRKGLAVRFDTWAYDKDPKIAHGIDFSTVQVPSKVGRLPAWYVPGRRATWVIGVHGRNASPGEMLRILPELKDLGFPVLAMTYRNDEGAPKAPDGHHHLGDTEWEDVAAAVDYARKHGAKDVVLYGWSMGGAIAMTTLRRMKDPAAVRGVILDSPVMDWSSTLDKQGDARNLPQSLTSLAKVIVELRTGLDFDALDQRPYARQLKTPILLFADVADKTVEVRATLQFARARTDLVELVTTRSDHTGSWNENPKRYEAKVREFLLAAR